MNEEIAWWNAHFGEPEVQRASATIRSNYLNEGALTRELEAKFATFLSAGHVDATPNGTVALALCLWALGIQPGEEVIVPDLTFIATANAVHMVGGRPVPVDVRSDDFTLSPEQTEAAITRKTKAIIVVHVNGRAVDLAAFQALRDKTGLPIIEDTAQGLGSKSGERYLGTIFDMAAISLAPSKIISTGQGGLVITNVALHVQIHFTRCPAITTSSPTSRPLSAWRNSTNCLNASRRPSEIIASIERHLRMWKASD